MQLVVIPSGARSAAVVVDFVDYAPRPSRLRARGLPVACELSRGTACKEPEGGIRYVVSHIGGTLCVGGGGVGCSGG